MEQKHVRTKRNHCQVRPVHRTEKVCMESILHSKLLKSVLHHNHETLNCLCVKLDISTNVSKSNEV